MSVAQLKQHAQQLVAMQESMETLYHDAEPSAVRLYLKGVQQYLGWAQVEMTKTIAFAELAEKVRRKKRRSER